MLNCGLNYCNLTMNNTVTAWKNESIQQNNFSVVSRESSGLINANLLSDYTNGELYSLFFQHMDSIQEALIDGFYALARDSVFVYEIERIERSRYAQNHQGDLVSEENTMMLYPNPSSETLHVVFEGSTGQIRVVNLLGEEVYRNINFSNYDRISLEGFNNGVYIIQFMDDNNYTESLRFVVLK